MFSNDRFLFSFFFFRISGFVELVAFKTCVSTDGTSAPLFIIGIVIVSYECGFGCDEQSLAHQLILTFLEILHSLIVREQRWVRYPCRVCTFGV
jgi:hypothetical protein